MKDLKPTLELFIDVVKNFETIKPSKKLGAVELAQEVLEAADAGKLDFDASLFTELTAEDQQHVIVLVTLGCVALSAL